MRTLRDYQSEAIAAVRREFERVSSTVLVLPTGCGKTVVMAKLASEWPGGNVLLLAHRIELLDQAQNKIGAELGYLPSIEQGQRAMDMECMWQGGHVLVGSVQTMCGDRRMNKFREFPFDLIMVDECFPAGTIIDGKPVEQIAVGDTVTAFDETGHSLVAGKVVRTFKRPAPKQLVRIHAAGRTVTCTKNHPFYTNCGWFQAWALEPGNFVAIDPRGRDDLDLYQVPEGIRAVASTKGGLEQDGPAEVLLLSGVQRGPQCGDVVSANGGDEPQARRRADASAEPNALRHSACESISHAQASRAQAKRSWREREAIAAAAEDAGRRPWLADGIRRAHQSPEGERLPNVLQVGHCRSVVEDMDRGGWRLTFAAEEAGAGSEKGRPVAWVRVDSVEILERGGDGTFGGVCPDGFVYNFEVSGLHTYVADGFVVHNCHHATSASYRKVIDFFRDLNPRVKVLGVTATPKRTDNTALGILFDSVAYELAINDAIDAGWLVPIVQEFVSVDGVDFSHVSLGQNEVGESDLKASELEQVLVEEEALHALARPIMEKAGDKQTLVFTAGVAHAHMLAAVLNRYRDGSAKAVDGKTLKTVRKEIVDDFAAGKLQFLTNYGVFTEGFDVPPVALVAMGRPTKSVGLYTQMLGRGMRPLDGVVDGPESPELRRAAIAASSKPSVLVLDFVGNSRHKLVSSVDVLGGNYDVETRELARRRANGKPADVLEELQKARAEIILLREQQRRRAVKANVDYSTERVNPFGHDGPAPAGQDVVQTRGGSSDAQIAFLVNLGVNYETAARYSSKQASAVISKLKAERCTNKQRSILARYGESTDVNFAEASAIITEIAANGWRRREAVLS